jgi:hypothetical protein
MAVSRLTDKDLSALLSAVGNRLGSDTTQELRDVLLILEKQGLVRVGLTHDMITIQLPTLTDDPPVTVSRP